MRARKPAVLRIIFTSRQTPFLDILSSRSIARDTVAIFRKGYNMIHSIANPLNCHGDTLSNNKPLKMMKNYLEKHLARKNNTLVKNSFMMGKSCVIEKNGQKIS